MNVHSVKQFSYTVGNSVVHYSFYQLVYQVPNAQEDQKQQLSTDRGLLRKFIFMIWWKYIYVTSWVSPNPPPPLTYRLIIHDIM